MEQDACIANIGPRERGQRLAFGLAGIGIGLALAVALVAFRAPWWWRLPLFFPFAGGAFGYFQWRDKT